MTCEPGHERTLANARPPDHDGTCVEATDPFGLQRLLFVPARARVAGTCVIAGQSRGRISGLLLVKISHDGFEGQPSLANRKQTFNAEQRKVLVSIGDPATDPGGDACRSCSGAHLNTYSRKHLCQASLLPAATSLRYRMRIVIQPKPNALHVVGACEGTFQAGPGHHH